MKEQVNIEHMVNMADSPDNDKETLPVSTESPCQSAVTTPVSTDTVAVLPNGGGGDSASCSTGTNSNSSSTQNLSVTPNGYNDVLQNGHLSASEDSGMGNMSDQGSQSSQSPNSNSNIPQYNKGHYYPRAVHPRPNYPMAIDPSLIAQPETMDIDPDDPVLNLPAPPTNHHGSSSPNCYSPNHAHSRGSSPNSQQGSPQAQPPQQHVVHVHVNPGETFSVRVGDQIQHIQGPATVRMVSNNGPPMPMPMQVPAGHMVQQIVDENGILTHVILSPQPPGMGGAPVTGGPNGTPPQPAMYPGPPYGHTGAPYNPYPTQYTPHHHPHPPPHTHPPANAHPTPQSHQCNNRPHHMYPEVGPQSHHNHGLDERTQKAKSRLSKKLKERKLSEQLHTNSSPRGRGGGGRSYKEGRMNGMVDTGHSSSSSVDGQEMEEDDRRLIRDSLSKLGLPKVSDIEPRSALITLSVPELTETELERIPDPRIVFQYELLLSEKKDAKYKCVYTGTCTGITLKDLKPATDYHLRVCCIYDSIKGELTDCVSFKTQCCEPECPQSPKLSQKTKTSLLLKWNQTVDNGSKISNYLLEYDQGLGNLQFTEVYTGLQRQFKVTKLSASTRYTFRLAAINSIGRSEFCEPVAFCTSGTVPSQPDPPMLSEQFVKALTISWIQRQNDDDFTLQMEDEATGHGFLTVYNGSDLSYPIKNLRRNTEYKFRLQSSNDEGSSKWSDTVCYKTLPDRPAPTSKPQLKGKAHSHSFRITWEPPRDTGGTEVSRYCVEVDAGRGFEVRFEGVEREFTCDQLEPGHCYRVRVKCYTNGGQSEWSECLVVTTQAVAPGKCHVPRLQGKPRAMSLHLKWNYPDYDGGARVVEFEVQMTNPDNTTREVYKGQDCDCVVAGLLPGRYYLFQVRAANKAGAGPWSDILEVVSGAGVPDPPKVPCVHCRSPHSATVSWEEPLNNGATITEYRLEWQTGPDTDFTQLHSGAVLSYEVKNLTPATSYSFRVQAVNTAGPGAYSPVYTAITPSSSPGSVVSLRASATAESIHLTWKEPISNGSDVVSYNIDLGEKHLIAVSNVLEYVIDDLLPETTYKVRVQAVNGIGVGAFSSPVKVTTRSLPPSPPRIECVSTGPNSLKLKWGEGKNPDLLQYCVEMLKDNGSYYPVYQGSGHSQKINRLQEVTEYSFRINARNQAGEGPYSSEYTFKTTKAPPPAVKEPQIKNVGLDCCEVNWPACKAMGKDNLIYILQLQQLSTNKETEYRQVYRGTDNLYKLSNLQSKCEYQVRVCAVRCCHDNTGDLTGAFSPGVAFITSSPKPVETVSTSSSVIHKLPERRQLSDQAWAAIILIGFTIVAIVIAFVAQRIITYTSSNAGDASLSNGISVSGQPPVDNDSTLH